MPFGDIVPILQTGLAGFAFLLAYLSYRVIAQEQKKEEPRVAILQSAQRYFYLCILLAVVVGSFEIARMAMHGFDQEQVAACLDSFDLLSSRKERATGEIELAQAAADHIARCNQLIRDLDKATK
jgi:hypothetical protein